MDYVIEDMAGAMIQHSEVISNFVGMVYAKLKGSVCKVYSDNISYTLKDENGGTLPEVIPDASINCRRDRRKGRFYIGAPRFVLEVLSPSTREYDRTEKKEIYCKAGVGEYWIVDWQKLSVEIYLLDYKDGKSYYNLEDTVTKSNKEALWVRTFPKLELDFDELFDI